MILLSKPVLTLLSLIAHLASAVPTDSALISNPSNGQRHILYHSPDDPRRCIRKPQTWNGCNCCPPNTYCMPGQVRCSVWPRPEKVLAVNARITDDGKETTPEHNTDADAKGSLIVHDRDISTLFAKKSGHRRPGCVCGTTNCGCPALSPSKAINASTNELIGAFAGSGAATSEINPLSLNATTIAEFEFSTGQKNAIFKLCKRRPAVWESLKPGLDFPTVETLLSDIRTCGNIGNNTIFLTLESLQNLQKLPSFTQSGFTDGHGVLITQAMELSFLLLVVDRYFLACPERYPSFSHRLSEAVALASSGNAYITRDHATPDKPFDAEDENSQHVDSENDDPWFTYKFPVLQRNAAIQNIFKVSLEDKSSARHPKFKVFKIWTHGVDPLSLRYHNATSSWLPPCRTRFSS